MNSSSLAPSPCPSDAYLWPTEEPFTVWDQLGAGKLDLRVFEQDIYWVDARRTPHFISDMSDAYITNVITYLYEEAEHHYLGMRRRETYTLITDMVAGTSTDLGAPMGSFGSARAWLEQTPLMVALTKRANA